MRPVTGGTDTHLSVVDLRASGVSGCGAEARAQLARITLNKNAVPYDPEPPAVASGIRVGTAAATTQGMGEDEMRRVAGLIAAAVTADPLSTAGARVLRETGDEVGALVERFPA
jgi:glycine hydroxymethyltransferase